MNRRLVVSLWACVLCAPTVVAQSHEFALHDGDRVVFYGDSITAQQLYTVYTETAVHALHPDWKIRFFNAGVGGDKVTGGIAGTIDERLDRDVFPRTPTVITIMLGMNDRGSDEAAFQTYVLGYRHILDRLRKEAPAARILLIGPSPLDDATRLFNDGNKPLIRYAQVVQDLAKEFKTDYVDFNRPVIDALRTAYKQNPLASQLLIPDRVHPQGAIHMVMAQTLLAAWNFPENIADVELDMQKGTTIRAAGSEVRDVHKTGDSTLEWTERDAPDVIPFEPEDGNLLWWRTIAPQQHLGRRRLLVRSLPASEAYQLEIDGKRWRRNLTASELSQGVDIADIDTPMHTAARAVYYACADSEIDQVVRNRLLGPRDAATAAGPMREEGGHFLDAAVDAAEQRILSAASRKTHQYKLLPARATAQK
jgi:lysophospholipase L1-like esterase